MNEVLVASRVLDSPSPADGNTLISSPETAKLTEKETASSDEELQVSNFKRLKGRIMKSDNESDQSESEGIIEKKNCFDKPTVASNFNSLDNDDSSSGEDLNIFKRRPLKSTITDKYSSSEDEQLSNKHESLRESPKKPEHSRIQSKQNKMKAKFDSLLLSRDKEKTENSLKKVVNSLNSDSSDEESHNETFSIENIKKKIEERHKTLKSTIYDPDTSDDEKAHIQEENEKNGFHYKKKTLPRPADRMSAKQAMENMKKIKSESNRMLREREVSLPYHRPKALSLKDILARKKPATSVDGTEFSIKMNEKQLQEYANMLEERQKLMMELCKSDSEGDAESDCEDNLAEEKSKNYVQDSKTQEDLPNDITTSVKNNVEDLKVQEDEEKMDISAANDDLFDSQVSEVNNLIIVNNYKESEGSDSVNKIIDPKDDVPANNTEVDSQLISLHYSESERFDCNPESNEERQNNEVGSKNQHDDLCTEGQNELGLKNPSIEHQNNELGNKTNLATEFEGRLDETNVINDECLKDIHNAKERKIENSINDNEGGMKKAKENQDQDDAFNDFLDDNEMNMDEIDRMIEDAEILETTDNNMTDSPMLIREPYNPRLKPRLTGAPGMLIDLDGTDATGAKKVSGIELLKQRFVYFTNLKTPEELQKQTRNRINPGLKHQKLKHELEEQIAEQRSIEWTKRLEEEKQQQAELNAIRGDDSDVDNEEDIDKLDAKLERDDVAEESEAETEPEENDVEIKDKPRERNVLVDDEAEESESEDVEKQDTQAEANNDDMEEGREEDDNDADEESGAELSDDESSSDDEMATTKPKKRRIIKAFEDSDEEDITEHKSDSNIAKEDTETIKNLVVELVAENLNEERNQNGRIDKSLNEDDVLQSAQLQKSISEDIFTCQDTDPINNALANQEVNKKVPVTETVKKPEDRLAVICETQPFDEGKFDDIVGMCSGSFSQNIVTTQAMDSTQSNEPSLTNTELNGDILALCTGKFYDNQFVSQQQENSEVTKDDVVTEDFVTEDVNKDTEVNNLVTNGPETSKLVADSSISAKENTKDDNLQSILEELNDPEFDKPIQNKFFTGSANTGSAENNQSNLSKKRFVIDSDDEEEFNKSENKVKKRKKKLEQRALQISDDEESELEAEVEDEYESALEDIDEDNADRLVEYDSEENEVEISIRTEKLTKKKTKARDFFEQEAELTSEDEWVGSGDEDEQGLDRMEREEGDDEHFHQGALQKQLGKIHMREMLDQDKREVRMIQELLLEDGDLGGGHRQRKFRWKNADGGEEEMGSYIEDMASTQEMEEEIESEEQWQRQSHERAMYLRQILSQQKDNDLDDVVESSFNQSAAPAKANISLDNVAVTNENAVVLGKKPSKDIPSPAKKPFALLQQHNSRGSILSRGDGALARLAALATPLAGEGNEDGPKVTSLGPSSKRNFVFTTVSPSAADKPKMTKRKAESIGTPNLMKKLKTDQKPARSAKTSLLDHLKG